MVLYSRLSPSLPESGGGHSQVSHIMVHAKCQPLYPNFGVLSPKDPIIFPHIHKKPLLKPLYTRPCKFHSFWHNEIFNFCHQLHWYSIIFMSTICMKIWKFLFLNKACDLRHSSFHCYMACFDDQFTIILNFTLWLTIFITENPQNGVGKLGLKIIITQYQFLSSEMLFSNFSENNYPKTPNLPKFQ